MERKELSYLVKALKAVYSDPKFIADQDAFNVWYELLKDIPYQVAHATVYKYISTNKFPPTIADIREGATSIVQPEQLGEGEAWALVYKAICNSAYNSVEEFNKLPKECQRAVGDPAILREWASLTIDEVNTVIQSNFMRSYRVASKNAEEHKRLPQATREVIEKISQHMKMLESGGANGNKGT